MPEPSDQQRCAQALAGRFALPRVLILIFFAANAAEGGAGPPLVTDDPGTVARGHGEINLATTLEQRPDERTAELPLLDVNYGLTDRVQLKYEVAWLARQADGAERSTGLSNSNVGVKWRFFDAGDGGQSMSMFPSVEFNNPGSSAQDRDLAGRGTTVILPFQYERRVHGFVVDFEVGRVFQPGADQWMYGLAASRAVSERFEVVAEVYGLASSGADRSMLAVNAGARVALSKHTNLLVAFGRELHDHFEERISLQGYCALQFSL